MSINSQSLPKTPSGRGNFMDNITDAARKTLLSAAMLTGLQTSPSYASSHQQTQKELMEVCNADNIDHKNSTLVMKAREYVPMQISYLEPEDILPIVGQIEAGDKYEHIEHLRIAEATRIRDMMWKHGAGELSAEEYQGKMERLNTGMTRECPEGYDNYEVIGGGSGGTPGKHANEERHILNSIVKHANFKINKEETPWYKSLKEFVENNPNSINIFGNSAYSDAYNKTDYEKRLNEESLKDLCRLKNFIIFAAGSNIENYNGIINKIYNGEYEADDNGKYFLSSLANSDKNKDHNNHIMVTIGTNKNGDANQTGRTTESSNFPIGFYNNVLFSGRGFPYFDKSIGMVVSEKGHYRTSYPNYVNVAMTDLCFQMFAEVKDVDELLEMIRSTALKDYIRLDMNGDGDTNDTVDGHPETVELQLINPAGFFREYCLPADTDLPSEIKTDETLPLNKGYYKGIVFNIPGAEVLINGERVAFDNENSTLIKSQNPFTLERRLNGELSKQLGCEGGIEGSIQAVDDERNGLKDLSKTFTVNINDIVSSIDEIKSEENSDKNIWYTVGGQKLSSQPTKSGVYIHNGNKVVIK